MLWTKHSTNIPLSDQPLSVSMFLFFSSRERERAQRKTPTMKTDKTQWRKGEIMPNNSKLFSLNHRWAMLDIPASYFQLYIPPTSIFSNHSQPYPKPCTKNTRGFLPMSNVTNSNRLAVYRYANKEKFSPSDSPKPNLGLLSLFLLSATTKTEREVGINVK